MSNKCVIVGAKRTPFGKYLGSLSEMEPLDVAVHAGRAALNAQGKDLSGEVEQIFAGNCIPGSFEGASVTGRQIGLKLGIDRFTVTLDTACCSPLTALRMALWGMRLGEVLGRAGCWGRSHESGAAYLARLEKRGPDRRSEAQGFHLSHHIPRL